MMQSKWLVQTSALWLPALQRLTMGLRLAAHQRQVQLEGVFAARARHRVARITPRPEWFIWL